MHRHTDTWKMQNSVGDLYEQASLLRNHNSCAQSTRGSILLLVIFRLHFHKNLLVHKLIASRILGSFHLRQTEQRTQDSLLLPIYKDISAWELAHGHTDLNTHANRHTHTQCYLHLKLFLLSPITHPAYIKNSVTSDRVLQ